jgi:hypothetical protein
VASVRGVFAFRQTRWGKPGAKPLADGLSEARPSFMSAHGGSVPTMTAAGGGERLGPSAALLPCVPLRIAVMMNRGMDPCPGAYNLGSMNQEETKTDLKAAMTSLLVAAAAADAEQWTEVRAHVDEAVEHCKSIIDQLSRRREAVGTVPASGESRKP